MIAMAWTSTAPIATLSMRQGLARDVLELVVLLDVEALAPRSAGPSGACRPGAICRRMAARWSLSSLSSLWLLVAGMGASVGIAAALRQIHEQSARRSLTGKCLHFVPNERLAGIAGDTRIRGTAGVVSRKAIPNGHG